MLYETHLYICKTRFFKGIQSFIVKDLFIILSFSLHIFTFFIYIINISIIYNRRDLGDEINISIIFRRYSNHQLPHSYQMALMIVILQFLGDPSRLHWIPTDGFGLFYFFMRDRCVLPVNSWVVPMERGRNFLHDSLLRLFFIILPWGLKIMRQLNQALWWHLVTWNGGKF